MRVRDVMTTTVISATPDRLRVDDHLTWVEDDLRHRTIDPDHGTYLDAGGPSP